MTVAEQEAAIFHNREITSKPTGLRDATETAHHVELSVGSGSYSFSLTSD